MFNKERFHNELAMRLGSERIIMNKRILISVDESDDPWVTLKIQGHDDIKFKASGNAVVLNLSVCSDIQNDLTEIVDAVHQTYLTVSNSRF